MDDEFKLCWKNFQDNIASGFQSLYDRGDLVDVTLACDGKLLQAHKIVLAICSPYFQEIFITNPCKHPIIILKDVSYTIMCELLEFMYQGVVNVKHTELQAFMKIGQLLQIKGLATNSSSSTSSSMSEKLTTNQNTNADSESPLQRSGSPTKRDISPPSNETEANNESSNNAEKLNLTNADSNTPQRTQSPAMSPASPSLNISSVNQKQGESQMQHNFHLGASGVGHKRHLAEFNSDSLSIYSRNKSRRFTTPTDQSSDNNEGSEVGGNNSMDQMNAEDFFLPHMSMVEGRYDLNSVKRESSDHHLHPNSTSAAAAAAAAASLRSSFNPAAFGLDYTFYKNNNSGSVSSGQEYPNDLNISSSDFSKSFANHMDIPPIGPGEHWFQGKLEFMLSQRGKPLLVHDGHTFGIQYVRKDKKYWQCNLSRKFNCKARVTTTDTGEIIVTNNEHCHTEIRQHLRKDYQRNKVMMNALINLSTNRLAVENLRRHNVNSIANNLSNLVAANSSPLALQSHMEAANAMAGTLLDLGKRTMSMDNNEEHVKINHHQHLHPHSHPHPQPQAQQEQRNLERNDERELSDEQPLDCGIRSADLNRYDRDGRNFKQESLEIYNNPQTHQQPTSPTNNNNSSNNSNNNENTDWQCKNESIQQ
uniref:BTB domain-containing protein n=1 Tax=Stomoxys calcitrans TaxID=35570 RepID=A0A1I8PVF4_STOCA